MPATPQPSSIPVPNPDIYLNYFPPDIAKQFEFARNLSLVTLGALLSDMLISLPEDVILIRSGIRPTVVAYFLSRVSTLAFALSAVIVKTYPESHCLAQDFGVAICWMISSASSSFLFLRRAQAIFCQRRFAQCLYSFLYVVNVGISCVVAIGSRAGPVGQTGWCINTEIAPYVIAAFLSRLVFDSCVFVGISYELATVQSLSGVAVTWGTIITGRAKSRIIRAILRGGQQYYLISVASNIVIVLLILIPGVPALVQVMFSLPDIALFSSMACRVFRNLKISSTNYSDANMGFQTMVPFPDASVGTTGNTDGDILVQGPIQIPVKSKTCSTAQDSWNK